jgi:hypothetical protein
MAHNTRRLTDAGTVIGTSADLADAFRDIDETTTKALNGADGGTFTAAATITIGGVGVQLACPVDMNGAAIAATSTNPLTHGALTATDDYIRLGPGHTGSTRTFRQWLAPVISPEIFWVTSADLEEGSAATSRFPGNRFAARLRVHDGATLASVVVRWKVKWAHAALPAKLPVFRVIRTDTNGDVQVLRADSGLASDGFIGLAANPSNLSNYQASNGPQDSATYVCDQNNVVDVSKYDYLVEIIDEDGTNAFDQYVRGNVFYWAETTVDFITSLRPQ